MKNINRRENPRMEIKLRCHVTAPALWAPDGMHTENISRNGLLIAWRGGGSALPLPNLGQILSVDVELPANHSFGKKCIHCEGVVARVTDTEGDCPRVALRVSYMDFRSLRDRISPLEMVRPAEPAWIA